MNDLNNYAKRFITAKSRNHSQGSISWMKNQIWNNTKLIINYNNKFKSIGKTRDGTVSLSTRNN